MKENFNIDQPHLKENPYSVPEGYFSSFQSNIPEIISKNSSKKGNSFWTVLKPQLALVSTFAFVFLMGYVSIKLFSPNAVRLGYESAAANSVLFENHHLESSFIDFFDDETDSLTNTAQINPEEIIEYLNTDADIVYLASLE